MSIESVTAGISVANTAATAATDAASGATVPATPINNSKETPTLPLSPSKRSGAARPFLATAGVLGLLTAVMLLPVLQSSVKVDLIRYALLALSVYLPLRAGQLSLASPGFYAIGGFVAAVFSTRYVKLDDNTGFWTLRALGRTWVSSRELYDLRFVVIEMLIAVVIAVVFGVIIGYLALRLQGIYLALATIAFVECVRFFTLDHEFFGFATGIFDIPQPVNTQIEYLWLVVPLMIACTWFVYRLERVRAGRALLAIQEDELASSATGIHPTYHKVLAFTLGAVCAAMAGVISAHFINTWNARQGTFEAATLLLACVVVGGSRTFLGPIVGGILLTAIPELLRWFSDRPFLPTSLAKAVKDGRPFVYGLLMVLVCIYFPQGLISQKFLERLYPRRRRSSGLAMSLPGMAGSAGSSRGSAAAGDELATGIHSDVAVKNVSAAIEKVAGQ
jgi:branched-chain amino acid transport system permease protein